MKNRVKANKLVKEIEKTSDILNTLVKGEQMNEKELLIALRLTQHNHKVLMELKDRQLEEKK